MPYISRERREILEPKILDLLNTFFPPTAEEQNARSIGNPFLSDGDINYIVTRIVAAHCFEPPLNDRFEPRYENYQKAIGIVECVKQELYRKGAAPYEDEKELQNGAVLRPREVSF